MNLDFVTFRHNLFTSSHLNMFCNSETIVFCISTASCPKESSVEWSVVSSAYKIKLNLVLDLTMSFNKYVEQKWAKNRSLRNSY